MQFGNTAMYWAARKGHLEVVSVLLEAGAEQNTIGANGFTALLIAVKGTYESCANLILQHPKTNTNQSTREGHSALSFACRNGLTSFVQSLIQRGVFLNVVDHQGDTPLMKAVKHGHFEVVQLMLSVFAEVDIINKVG